MNKQTLETNTKGGDRAKHESDIYRRRPYAVAIMVTLPPQVADFVDQNILKPNDIKGKIVAMTRYSMRKAAIIMLANTSLYYN